MKLPFVLRSTYKAMVNLNYSLNATITRLGEEIRAPKSVKSNLKNQNRDLRDKIARASQPRDKNGNWIKRET